MRELAGSLPCWVDEPPVPPSHQVWWQLRDQFITEKPGTTFRVEWELFKDSWLWFGLFFLGSKFFALNLGFIFLLPKIWYTCDF